jgi:hypothetical protein
VNDGAVHRAAEEGAGRPTHRVHLNILKKKKIKTIFEVIKYKKMLFFYLPKADICVHHDASAGR